MDFRFTVVFCTLLALTQGISGAQGNSSSPHDGLSLHACVDLHVTMTPEAVLDPVTHQLTIKLTCGSFLVAENAAFAVQWVTPSGQILASSGFDNHHFYLLLPAVIEDGNYTCSVSQSQICLHGGESQASLYVIKTDARFAILEKKYQTLQQAFQQTVQELQTSNTNLSSTVHHQQNQITDLKLKINHLATRAGQQVAFHALQLKNLSPPKNTPLIFPTISYNIGEAYSASTGYVTVPYAGVYFFIVTTGAYKQNTDEFHYILVDYAQVALGYSYNENNINLVTAHAVVHAQQGQRIWVVSGGGKYAGFDYATFSGFLLFPDP